MGSDALGGKRRHPQLHQLRMVWQQIGSNLDLVSLSAVGAYLSGFGACLSVIERVWGVFECV